MKSGTEIRLIKRLLQSAAGCFALMINFLGATVLLWTVIPAEFFFAKIILTSMFIPLGLTFGLIGVMRLKAKKD